MQVKVEQIHNFDQFKNEVPTQAYLVGKK